VSRYWTRGRGSVLTTKGATFGGWKATFLFGGRQASKNGQPEGAKGGPQQEVYRWRERVENQKETKALVYSGGGWRMTNYGMKLQWNKIV